MIAYAAIGIIFSTYACDGLFEVINGRTYALQLIPNAKVISERNDGEKPF